MSSKHRLSYRTCEAGSINGFGKLALNLNLTEEASDKGLKRQLEVGFQGSQTTLGSELCGK